MALKESLLRQKSGQLWLRDGDNNTIFFHKSMKDRFRRNFINVVDSPSDKVEGILEVKEAVKSNFDNFFKETNFTRPVPEGITFNCVFEEDNGILEEPFNESEIKKEVWSCNGSKSVDPDGFIFEFLKHIWVVIKDDAFRFMKYFHSKAKLTKACTYSFIILIPKVNNPQSLSEYRLICFVGCLYKILAKLLAFRLKKVIGKIIS